MNYILSVLLLALSVNITFGPQATWQDKALKNADILYSASDNQMVAFLQTHSKNFQQETVSPLYLHKSIILVQKGGLYLFSTVFCHINNFSLFSFEIL